MNAAPAPVTHLTELLDRQAADALALAGARSSAWNGEIGWLPRAGSSHPGGVVGLADWDGTIYFDRDYVLRPLQAVFAKGGDLGEPDLARARNALAVVLHENCHLLGEDPADHGATRSSWSWPLVVLEEGATEAFTEARLDAYVRRLGLDRLAPGLLKARTQPAYPLFVPAVATLVSGVGRLTGQAPAEVLRRLVAQSGGRKFGTLGGMVLQGTGLAGRMPEPDRGPAAEEIADATREAFGEIARVGPLLSRDQSLALSRHAGRSALRGVLGQLERLEDRYPEAAGRPERAPLPPGLARSPARDPGRDRTDRGRAGRAEVRHQKERTP